MGMGSVGTSLELERRRRRAVELVRQGESPATVARFLGCGRSTVYTWVKAADRDAAALAARPMPVPGPDSPTTDAVHRTDTIDDSATAR